MKHAVAAVAIHGDGERLAIATSSGGWVYKRSGDGNYVARQFDALKYAISMDFSNDGSRLLCGRIDYTARVFLFDDKESISAPLRHSGPVVAVAFGKDFPGGELAVTLSASFEDGMREQSLQLWDMETGESLTPPIKIEGSSKHPWLQFAPARVGMDKEGRQLSVHYKDGMTSLWDVSPSFDGEVPSWISNFGEAIGGIRLGDNGRWVTVAFEEYVNTREQVLEHVSAGVLGDWAKWVMATRSERSISPNSQTGVREWIDRRMSSSNIMELRLALRLCPDHPTIRALLAEKLFVKSPESSEAQWFLDSAKKYFEAPVLELPPHVSEHQYRLGKEVLKRIDR
jgi:WD40 repeat protein